MLVTAMNRLKTAELGIGNQIARQVEGFHPYPMLPFVERSPFLVLRAAHEEGAGGEGAHFGD